jgi:trans-aconitate methyltransferase
MRVRNRGSNSFAHGHDIYRDHLNTPAFFAMLPDVEGLAGLDIGCGEGHNTRLLA